VAGFEVALGDWPSIVDEQPVAAKRR